MFDDISINTFLLFSSNFSGEVSNKKTRNKRKITAGPQASSMLGFRALRHQDKHAGSLRTGRYFSFVSCFLLIATNLSACIHEPTSLSFCLSGRDAPLEGNNGVKRAINIEFRGTMAGEEGGCDVVCYVR